MIEPTITINGQVLDRQQTKMVKIAMISLGRTVAKTWTSHPNDDDRQVAKAWLGPIRAIMDLLNESRAMRIRDRASICPQCSQHTVTVQDSRVLNGRRVRRRRCDACGYRWHTVEVNVLVARQFDAAGAAVDAAIATLVELRGQMAGVVVGEDAA